MLSVLRTRVIAMSKAASFCPQGVCQDIKRIPWTVTVDICFMLTPDVRAIAIPFHDGKSLA